MRTGLAGNVTLATGVFLVVSLAFDAIGGAPLAVMPVVFSALVFAMLFAAIQVGIVLFREAQER